MKKKSVLLTGMVLCSLAVNAQAYKEGYVDWGYDSKAFADAVSDWTTTKQVNADDNFFISRVKPKAHFRNTATQVRENLTAENDKKLIAWIPINGVEKNAMPDGVFDSEVFSMWPYVTHWGNWTAPLGRIPGGFLDVAHKNGVGVSSVASIPWGWLEDDWKNALTALGASNADDVAAFFRYYGCDGMGYNSEFNNGYSVVGNLRTLHEKVVAKSRETNPLFENFWYDGTNDNGMITFDQGLGSHNDDTFGDGEHIRTSLFFNYNWNNSSLLSSSVSKAEEIGRDPLDLYAGCNMQGNEPAYNNWPLLKDYRISIGLWGAHNNNMFWESRGEKGSNPDIQQRSYLLRTERWFTGGTRNPANCPEVITSMKYNVDNFDFHGMSSFMTARSSLKWNLGEEPFISYFNLGNGKFFNWQGVRQHSRDWYNIGVQDYLPTWRFWFSSKLLSGNAADVPEGALDAEFTWDEAYVGGSSLRVYGTATDEYLHLFKTEFALQADDEITVRYKVKKGAADMNLVLTAKGAEETVLNEGDFQLLTTTQETDEDEWVVRTYKVGDGIAGKDLSLVALHFKNAANLDLYLGEFSIVRGTATTPAKPEITHSEVLAYNKSGVDAKLIFNMANDKPAGEPCYNVDVNTSMFKLYSQQEGMEPKFEGITTSWAALMYSSTMDLKAESSKMRFGVSALSLDMKSESDIAWTDYTDAGTYIYDDDIQISQTTIKPNEAFELSYVDPKHEDGTWEIIDQNGESVFTGTGHSVTVEEGLPEIGSYTLKLKGNVYAEDGVTRTETTREFGNYVQITGEGVGAVPKIYTLTANDKEADIEVKTDEEINFEYTGRKADGAGSQGVDLQEQRFGVKAGDVAVNNKKSFSVACWLKINKLASGETQLLAVADKKEGWPKTDWGWIWTNIDATGAPTSFTFRGTDMTSNNELRLKYEKSSVPIGSWVHLAYVFDYNASGDFRADFYINGVKQEITSWNRTTDGDIMHDGDPGYQSNIYDVTSNMVISMGGNASGRNGIDGTIDNFMVWNKAISAEEVKTSMGDLSAANLPADVISFWSLDEKVGEDFTFKSVGATPDVSAGIHSYTALEGEGEGEFHWDAPTYTSGCPFISGTAFPVTTVPTWKAKKATVTEATGSDESGSAKVTYAKAGDYSVTLTLANSLGSASRTFQVIKVTGKTDGIDNVENGSADAYVVGDKMFVEFAEAGNYNVRVYNVAGQLVASKAQQMGNGQQMQITLGQVGTYVLDIQKDGRTVRTVKLLRK